jgi:integrase
MPRQQRLPLHLRPVVNLRDDRTLLAATVVRRRGLYRNYEDWVGEAEGQTIAALVDAGPRYISDSLAAYGEFLYSRGDAHGIFVDTINSVVDKFRHLRRQLQAAKDVAEAWKLLMPVANHVPTPEILMLAMTSLAFIWHWEDVAILVYLSFVCMLRPGEALRLKYSDLLLPSRLLSNDNVAYVSIIDPKMRRLAARREHVRLECPYFIAFLESYMLNRSGPLALLLRMAMA